MKAVAEHLIVAVLAVAMGFFGWWWMSLTEGNGPQIRTPSLNLGWNAYWGTVAILTWIWLYRMCRKLHWLVLPIMGLFAPIIASVLFFPLTPFVWIVIGMWAYVIFPVSVLTGFLISAATLPFRPKWVWTDEV